MLIVEGDRPFVVIPTPKTGSSSVEDYLRGSRSKLRHGKHRVDAEYLQQRPNALVAMTIRHPQDIIVSWWKYKYKAQGLSFDDTLLKMLTRDSGYVARGRRIFYGHEYADTPLKLEDGLQPQIDACLVRCGIAVPEREFLRANDSHDRTPWPEFYSRQTAEMVYNAWSEDFDDYGYEIGYAGQ